MSLPPTQPTTKRLETTKPVPTTTPTPRTTTTHGKCGLYLINFTFTYHCLNLVNLILILNVIGPSSHETGHDRLHEQSTRRPNHHLKHKPHKQHQHRLKGMKNSPIFLPFSFIFFLICKQRSPHCRIYEHTNTFWVAYDPGPFGVPPGRRDSEMCCSLMQWIIDNIFVLECYHS